MKCWYFNVDLTLEGEGTPNNLFQAEDTSSLNIQHHHGAKIIPQQWPENGSSLFYVLTLQYKKCSHVTLKQFIKGWASSAGTEQITHKQREGEGKVETTWFEYPRSLGKCGDLFRIGVSGEGRRMNENQQTRWIKDENDWLKCNLAWKYSPALFPHEFNRKFTFASFIAASASYLVPSAPPL